MLEKLKAHARGIKREIRVYRLLISDRRTPLLSRVLLALAVGYLFSPLDIIPDFIPVVGLLDDVIIVPGLIFLAVKFIPKDLIGEIRAKVNQA